MCKRCESSQSNLWLCTYLVGVCVGDAQLSLVVEHLLKVGHVPPLVRGVPGEPLGDVVEDPPLGHHLQGVEDHLQRLLRVVPVRGRFRSVPEQKVEVDGLKILSLSSIMVN